MCLRVVGTLRVPFFITAHGVCLPLKDPRTAEPAGRVYNPSTMSAIVIAAHGCPVGFLGPYGNEWVTTPNLDRLAAEGVVYDRHYATRRAPLGARRGWWESGRVADSLRESATLIRASRPAFDAPPDYYARFAEVFDARPDPADPSPYSTLHRMLPGVLDKLANRSDWRLWIETDRLLPPWHIPPELFEVYCEDLTDDAEEEAEPLAAWADPPVGWFDRDDTASWELLHRSFAAAVSAFDADLGWIFDLFRDRGFDRTATWAFTSDFGYPLGEHGIVGPHRPWLHEEFVHVPLIVRRPDAAGAGQRVWDMTTPEEVSSLLFAATCGSGTTTPAPAGRGEEGVVSLADIAGHREASLRTDTHALLLPLSDSDDEPRSPQLFEKPDDRWEVNDVRQPNLELADEMERELRARLAASPDQ